MVWPAQPLSWLLLALLTGCAGLFPHGERQVVAPWASFDEAKAAFDQIAVYQTRDAELADLGFSPGRQANVRILSHADITDRFTVLTINDVTLPRGLRECLDRCDACYGYEVRQRVTRDHRYGNFLADFLNFKRKTEVRGWEFNALLVLIDGLVVYKVWGGTPDIHEYHDETNPLGPLQGVGPALTPHPGL